MDKCSVIIKRISRCGGLVDSFPLGRYAASLDKIQLKSPKVLCWQGSNKPSGMNVEVSKLYLMLSTQETSQRPHLKDTCRL